MGFIGICFIHYMLKSYETYKIINYDACTYHVSNRGSCSWFEFAQKIFSYANMKVNVLPVSNEEFGSAAARPKYSIFQHNMLRLNSFLQMPSWEEGLERFFIETKSH